MRADIDILLSGDSLSNIIHALYQVSHFAKTHGKK
jgi:hypothetical protein